MTPLRILLHLPRRFREADLPLLSASLAFSTLLSLIPFLAVGFAVLHAITGFEGLSGKLEQVVLGFLKSTAGPDASMVVKKVLRRLSKTSWTVTIAVVLIVTSMRLFLNLEAAVNRIWLTREERTWWRRILLVSGFYLAIPIGLSIYAGLRSAEFFRPIFALTPALWDIGVMFVLLLLFNRWFPVPHVRWRTAFAGAVASACGLFVLAETFAWFTRKVFNYSKVYGSLAALPLLCLLFLMTWQIILTGVALASALQDPVGRKRLGPKRTA